MRFKNLDRYRTGGTGSRRELSIPLPTTPEGRVYRFSPNEAAHPRHFVLGEAPKDFVPSDEASKRMKLTPRSNQCVCPYSGTIAGDDEFTHPEDAKAALKIVEHAAHADVQEALNSMFKDFGRQSSSSFLKVEVRGNSTPKPRPRFSRRDLLRELVCDHCGRDYGVFAIGLFCPDCGAPNLKLHFAREIELVSKQVELADAQTGQQELAYRLMGNAHEDVLTAFEATLKAVYLYGTTLKGSSPAKAVKNDFQNIERAQQRFAELGLDPFSTLTPEELVAMRLNIQKRHIIGHNLGVMDEKFADHAASARLGETVHLVGEDIRQFALLAQRVVESLDHWLVAASPSTMVPIIPVPIPAAIQPPAKNEDMPDLGLSELATRLGKWIAQHSTEGLDEHVDLDAALVAFSDANEDQLAEAIAELDADQYVTTSHTMSHVLPRTRPTIELFATFDPIIGIGDPVADSLALVEKVLSMESVPVETLHQSTGWPMRRFNPAIGRLIAELDERSISKESEWRYPARYFRISAEDRVSLKRYAARLAG